jgi:hypothetical protein
VLFIVVLQRGVLRCSFKSAFDHNARNYHCRRRPYRYAQILDGLVIPALMSIIVQFGTRKHFRHLRRRYRRLDMSPLPAPTRVQVRADEMAVITSTAILSTSTSTSTQQSPCRPSSTGGIMTDSSTPPLSIPPSLPSTLVIETPLATPPPPGMSFGTKLGLGMIPVVIGVCVLWMIFLFWWRRRQKTRKASQNVEGEPAPRVPEKDFLSLVPSLESSRRGSKVFNMAAFSTPIHNASGKRREAQVYRESEQQRIDTEKEATTEHAIGQSQPKHNDSYSDMVRLANSGASRTGPDSPIDRTCPFRLKRGNTIRGSLGSEISNLWPSPPPEVWVKRPNMTERPHSPTFSRQSW